ncbi:ferritin [Draconibacterium orientale]|uniref:Ferritin n=1 Tax=Draconibacterium orientale TaxID=1168034 RepID=X5DIL2_9BACT|nr:ferritin [Draconibacterium orientale]AHW60954.1 ferritin [Draconibacterium orientale]SET85908.1 ferritin [Draconibacterium orientale]
MLKEKMLKALNEQINAEQYSSLLYLSMSAYFNDKGLPGFANWMYVQYQEELTHANKFFNYVVERGGKVELKAIDQMPTTWEGVIDVYEKTLEHEQLVTSLIDKLVDVAIEEKDHATQSFLRWFVDEQVEEEANVTEILDTLKLINGQGNGIFMLDREMRNRTFVDTTAAAQ